MAETHQNVCFYSMCTKSPIIMCRCNSSETYSCSRHLGIHIKNVNDTHQIIDVPFSILKGPNKVKFLTKLEKIILELNSARQMTLNACNDILVSLSQSIKKYLSKIKSVKSSIIEVKNLILSNQQINHEVILNLKTVDTYNATVNYQGIIEKITEMATLEAVNKDKFILHSEQDDPNLYAISMNSLTNRVLSNFSNYWYLSAACKISKNEYFCTGGFSIQHVPSPYIHGNTSIVDIKNRTQTVLESATPRAFHCCIFKENQIYVFGGWYDQKALSSAAKFDMTIKSWSSLPNLPIAAHDIYPSLINNEIAITGYQLAGVYVFSNNAYVKNLNLEVTYYITCDQWIAGHNALYECIDLGLIKWEKYNIVFSASRGSLNTTYKRKEYFYWISCERQLWRIDTNRKVAESLRFN